MSTTTTKVRILTIKSDTSHPIVKSFIFSIIPSQSVAALDTHEYLKSSFYILFGKCPNFTIICDTYIEFPNESLILDHIFPSDNPTH